MAKKERNLNAAAKAAFESALLTPLQRAEKDGYINITGPEGKRKIEYITSERHSENYEDPEEKVRAEFFAELIYKYEYPANRIKVEVVVPDRLPTDRADIVVFSDNECKRPYAIVECKKEGVTDAEFNQAIEQGVGNATWVKLRAEYVVIIAGGTRRVLDVSDKFGAFEREQNILADLPRAYGKPQEFRFYKGTENDIKPVAREDLIAAIKKCHQTLWGGGRLSPPTAFGELCKLIFVKISDEQKPRKKGEPYQFQIKTHEPSSKLAERINALYDEQKVKDPEVFTESIKVDDRVLRTVVSHLEAINLNKTDLDVKGVAFEQFMDGFFKGDFGQYFTPRPIIEFCVNMMKPEQDWDVLDPSCGSGGFLLHALDYMRKQAGDYYEKGTVDYFNYWHDFAAKHLYGIEINDEIARVAKMNMIVHDDGHTNVISHDALESIDKMHDHNRGFAENRFDLILTNPPFGSTINLAEKPYLSTYELGNNVDAKGKKKPRKNQSSEVLFIERIWQFLKPGIGKAAIVLPDGILTNSSMQYVRDFILEKLQLLAVVSLPQCAFAHFGAGVKASVIFVRKRKANEKTDENEAVFMAAPELIGYDATGRKTSSQFEEIAYKYKCFQSNPSEYVLANPSANEACVFAVMAGMIEGRIDPHFYLPKFRNVVSLIKTYKYAKLGEIASFSKETTDFSEFGDEFEYLEISGVELGTNAYSTTTTMVAEAPSRAKMRTQRGDIVISMTRPHRGAIAEILENGIIASTGFSVIRDVCSSVNKKWLLYTLLSEKVLLQMLQRSSGGNYPAITEDEIKKIYIPLPSYEKQIMMVQDIERAILDRKTKLLLIEEEWKASKLAFENELLGE